MDHQEKKSFFELLEPKSALIVGVITGFLAICTIGFIILSALALTGGLNCSAKAAKDNPSLTATGAQQQTITQAPKTDRPKVELFIMTYCPYGLQMQKAYYPVYELLGKTADFEVKFVDYIMHEKLEIDENTRQYCIQKEQSAKYLAYMKCFTAKDDYKTCLKQAGVNESQMNKCVTGADKEFGITNAYNDQSSWLSGRYPIYPVHEDLNEVYGVLGSPTLVINGVQIDVSRSPEAVKQAVCAAYNNAPDECNKVLDTNSMSPGFGTAAASSDIDASCG
jgi:hypothetical protein